MSEEKFEEIEEIQEYKPRLIKLLNIIAGVLFVVMIFVIYLPARIWNEEEHYREIGRNRLEILDKVENYYQQMAGEYQSNPILAMNVVSAVRDSTMADSNFSGEQKVFLTSGVFDMDVIKNFHMTFDTTFALEYQRRDTIIDTTYKILQWNVEEFVVDTIFVLSSKYEVAKTDTFFRGLIDTEISSRVATNTYYRPFYLDSVLAYNPLINEQYQVELDEDNIKIKDPLQGEFKESRYLVFAFKDTSHGWIENGTKSWEQR